jgi:two-component system chemotaxis response regulator CheY
MLQILLIDDTKSVHAYMRLILNKINGVAIESVFNGVEACELLKKNAQFDLIFLDWEMPLMNGPETLRAIGRLNLEIPIIMMTSKNEITDIELALGLGASEYMMKPFTNDIVFEKMKFVMKSELIYAS